MKLPDILKDLKRLRDAKKTAKKHLENLGEKEAELEERAIELMDADDVDSTRLTLSDGTRFTFYQATDVYVRIEDDVAFSEWCEKEGFNRQDVNMISVQKLKALYRERMADPDTSLPAGVSTYEKTRIRARKA